MTYFHGRQIAAFASCLFALGGCGAEYVTQGDVVLSVSVTSTTTDEFYYARRDIFIGAGLDEKSRRQQMTARPAFGPYQTNQTILQLVDGFQYVFYPRCANAVSWKDGVGPVINPSIKQMKVDCKNA